MDQEKQKYEVGYQSPYGNYKVVYKEFNDQKHIDNYVNVMSKNGYNIISITKLVY
jgi:hypothetical protein